MTGYRRGSIVLFILHLSVHSWPESQAVYWAWETSSVLLLNPCNFLLFSPSSLFPASRLNKTGYNSLRLLVNWGKSLRHIVGISENAIMFSLCYCHVQQTQVTPSCFSFWWLHYSCKETKTCLVSKIVPQTTAICHSPKAWEMLYFHSEVYIRGMQISYHCSLPFAKRQHVK